MAADHETSQNLQGGGSTLGPEAYKKLYPAEFYKQFIQNGIRPDGRSFGMGRPVNIGLKAIEGPAASALVKIGSTSVLAGVTFEIMPPTGDAMDAGQVEVTVTVTPLSLGILDRRKLSEVSQILSLQVQQALESSNALDVTRLASKSKKAALKANLEMHVLDADGALRDACLLSAGATLASLRHIPHADALENGGTDIEEPSSSLPSNSKRAEGFCDIEQLPFCHTLGLYSDHLILDPSSEEEALMDGCAFIALDSKGNLAGFDASKPANSNGISTLKLFEIIEAAKLRHKDILQLLKKSLQEHMQ